VTYDVVIGVSNQDLKLFPGMTATVKILVDRHNAVLRVPNSALRFRPPESRLKRSVAGTTDHSGKPGGRVRALEATIWVLNNKGKPQPETVQTGLSDGIYTEIAGGPLKEGDKVIIAATSKAGSAPSSPGGARPGRPGF
jgi:HlyD family secretion protein